MKTQIQRIMVPLDPSEFTMAATIRACEVAKVHDASLTGLSVLDTPEISGAGGTMSPYPWPMIQEGIAFATADARHRIGEARDRFARTCRERGVRHVESQFEGLPEEVVLDASGLFDLVVIGLRTYFHFETEPGAGDSLAKLLRRTATPILAVPKAKPGAPFRHAVITYDGSMNAARALREFVGFAAPFDIHVTVVTANQNTKEAQQLLNDASAYLAAHGIDNVETVHSRKKTVTDDLLGAADLVVLGIHSKRFFKDRFVGSFTNHMIDRGDTTLFLSH